MMTSKGAKQPKKNSTPKNVEKAKTNIDKQIDKVEKQMEKNIIGQVKKPIFQKSAFIKKVSYRTPVMLHHLPEDLRKYLTNKWWWTNVWEKGEEWLEKHHADMDKIRELKKFISEHYL